MTLTDATEEFEPGNFGGMGEFWAVDVDDNGTAFTWYVRKQDPLLLSQDEIEHVRLYMNEGKENGYGCCCDGCFANEAGYW